MFETNIRLAVKAELEKKYEEAISFFNKAISLTTNKEELAFCQNKIANIHYVLKQYNDAIRFFSLAIENDKMTGEYYLGRGFAFFKLNRFEEACKDFKSSLQIHKTNKFLKESDLQFVRTVKNAFNAANELVQTILSTSNNSTLTEAQQKTLKEEIISLNKVIKEKSIREQHLSHLDQLIKQHPQNSLLYLLREKLHEHLQRGQEGLTDKITAALLADKNRKAPLQMQINAAVPSNIADNVRDQPEDKKPPQNIQTKPQFNTSSLRLFKNLNNACRFYNYPNIASCIPFIYEVVDPIAASNHAIFLAGETVRDVTKGLIPKNFDLVTTAPIQALINLFGPTVIETDYSSKVTISFNGICFFNIKRLALYDQVGLHAALSHDCWEHEFTMDALYWNPDDGRILDYCDGFNDLMNNQLRMLGTPEDRLTKSPILMLRAIRFIEFFKLQIEPSLYRALSTFNGDFIYQITHAEIQSEFQMWQMLLGDQINRVAAQWRLDALLQRCSCFIPLQQHAGCSLR